MKFANNLKIREVPTKPTKYEQKNEYQLFFQENNLLSISNINKKQDPTGTRTPDSGLKGKEFESYQGSIIKQV